MDVVLFRLINNLASRSLFLDGVGIFLSSWLIWVMVSLFIIFVFLRKSGPAIFLVAVFSGFLAWGFNYLVSLVYFRPRPFAALDGVHQLIVKEATEKGFPSDHATLAFALAAVIFLVDRKWGTVFLALAMLVALGRVFVGVHYPGDVAAGAVVGVGWAVLMFYFVRLSFQKYGR